MLSKCSTGLLRPGGSQADGSSEASSLTFGFQFWFPCVVLGLFRTRSNLLMQSRISER